MNLVKKLRAIYKGRQRIRKYSNASQVRLVSCDSQSQVDNTNGWVSSPFSSSYSCQTRVCSDKLNVFIIKTNFASELNLKDDEIF